MTRDARLSALHRGGFGPRGRASVSFGARRPTTAGRCPPDPRGELLAAPASGLAGGGPGPAGANGYKPPAQDATPRSAFRMSPEDALNERGCVRSSIGTIRSQ